MTGESEVDRFVGEGYRCRWRMCYLFGRRGWSPEVW